MTFGYLRPFSITIEPQPILKVEAVRHGVTEITLNDGRLVRATLHVKNVKPNAKDPNGLDVVYNIVAEVIKTPQAPILPVHETVQ
jgi:hypothetical protein